MEGLRAHMRDQAGNVLHPFESVKPRIFLFSAGGVCSSIQAAKGPPDRAREAPGNHTRPEARQDRTAAQTAAEAARRGRGRLWQPLPGREAHGIQDGTQAAHRATRAGPVPHPLPGAGIGPRRPGNWPRSERQRREDHRQPDRAKGPR